MNYKDMQLKNWVGGKKNPLEQHMKQHNIFVSAVVFTALHQNKGGDQAA